MYNYSIKTGGIKFLYAIIAFLLAIVIFLVVSFGIKLSILEKQTGASSYELVYINPREEYANEKFSYLYTSEVYSRVKLYDSEGTNAINTVDDVNLYISFNNYVNKITTLLFFFYGVALCIIVVLAIFAIYQHRVFYQYLLTVLAYLIQFGTINSSANAVFFLSFILIAFAIIINIREHKKILDENEFILNRYE